MSDKELIVKVFEDIVSWIQHNPLTTLTIVCFLAFSIYGVYKLVKEYA